jgi:hypothetical protein
VRKAAHSCALCQRLLLATAGGLEGRAHSPARALTLQLLCRGRTSFAAAELRREEGRLSASLVSFAPVREGQRGSAAGIQRAGGGA